MKPNRVHHQFYLLSRCPTFFLFFFSFKRNLTSTFECESQFLTHARVPEANLASTSRISVSTRTLVAGNSTTRPPHPAGCQNVSPVATLRLHLIKWPAGQCVSGGPWGTKHQLRSSSSSSSGLLTLPRALTPAMIPKCGRRWSAFFSWNII